jgi:hypothetical protein
MLAHGQNHRWVLLQVAAPIYRDHHVEGSDLVGHGELFFGVESEVTDQLAHKAAEAAHRRLQKRSSWQPTFVHLDRGSRTVPVVIAKMQVNNSVGLGGHNTKRVPR